MFRVDFFEALFGCGLALAVGSIQLAAQLRSEEGSFTWKEPLLFPTFIMLPIAFSKAFGGIFRGDGLAWLEAVAMTVSMFPFMVAGSLAGRGAGWMLQRL
jgi:hypothetical protein